MRLAARSATSGYARAVAQRAAGSVPLFPMRWLAPASIAMAGDIVVLIGRLQIANQTVQIAQQFQSQQPDPLEGRIAFSDFLRLPCELQCC